MIFTFMALTSILKEIWVFLEHPKGGSLKVVLNYYWICVFLCWINNNNRNTGKDEKYLPRLCSQDWQLPINIHLSLICGHLNSVHLSACLELKKVKIPSTPGWNVCGTDVCKFHLTYLRGKPCLFSSTLPRPRSEKTMSRVILEAMWCWQKKCTTWELRVKFYLGQNEEFSAFLCMGRCKSLGSLKSFLWYAPQLSGASILCFHFLSFLRAHHREWLQSCQLLDGRYSFQPWVSSGLTGSSWRVAVVDECDTLCLLTWQEIFHL